MVGLCVISTYTYTSASRSFSDPNNSKIAMLKSFARQCDIGKREDHKNVNLNRDDDGQLGEQRNK